MTDRRPDRVDVLAYRGGASHRAVEAGRGQAVVSAHETELRRRRLLKTVFEAALAVGLVGYGVLTERVLLGGVAALIVAGSFYVGKRRGDEPVPEVVERNLDRERAGQRTTGPGRTDADGPSVVSHHADATGPPSAV